MIRKTVFVLSFFFGIFLIITHAHAKLQGEDLYQSPS